MRQHSEARRSLLAWVFLGICALGSYWNALSGPFLSDDARRITAQEKFYSAGLWPAIQAAEPDRPLAITSLWIDYSLYGMHPRPFKATNLFLHLMMAILLFEFGLRASNSKSSPALSRSPAQWMTWLLLCGVFVCHPTQVIPIHISAERCVILAALFGFLSFQWGALWTKSPRHRVLSVAALTAAVLAKPSALAVPLILALYWLMCEKCPVRKIPLRLFAFLPVAAIPIWFYFFEHIDHQSPPYGYVKSVLIQTVVLSKYFFNYFVPIQLEYMYGDEWLQVPLAFSAVAIALGSISVYGVFRLANYFKNPRILFFYLAFWIGFLPESFTVPLTNPIMDYRSYFSFLFLTLFIWECVLSLKKDRRLWLVPLLGILVFVPMTVERNRHFNRMDRFVFYAFRKLHHHAVEK